VGEQRLELLAARARDGSCCAVRLVAFGSHRGDLILGAARRRLRS
jgi:hypothetical protein